MNTCFRGIQFGMKVNQVALQEQETVTETVTRKSSKGVKPDVKEKVTELPLSITLQLVPETQEDKEFIGISGFGYSDYDNRSRKGDFKIELIQQKEGKFEVVTSYDYDHVGYDRVTVRVKDRYVDADDYVAPYTRAGKSYWTYKNETQSIPRPAETRTKSRTTVLDQQEFNQFYKGLLKLASSNPSVKEAVVFLDSTQSPFVKNARSTIQKELKAHARALKQQAAEKAKEAAKFSD